MLLWPIQLLEYQTDVRRCRFDKPSSLLRSYIADTSALPMLELGLIPVVTTMTPSGLGRVWGARQLFERSDHRRVRGEGQRGGGEDSKRVRAAWRGLTMILTMILTMMMRMKLLLIRMLITIRCKICIYLIFCLGGTTDCWIRTEKERRGSWYKNT